MADYSVKRLANGRTIRQLVFAFVLLAASLAICWQYQQQIYSRMMGPFQATPNEIAAIPTLDGSYRRFFEMNAKEAVVLPFRDVRVHRRRGRETGRSFSYFHLVDANPPLLLRAGVDKLAFPVMGALVDVPEEVRSRLAKVAPKLMSGPGIAAVMIDVEDPAWSFDSLLAMGALVAPFLFLGLFTRAVMRMMNYERVPGVAALKQFGPVGQMVGHIDGEFRGVDPKTSVSGALLTPSWLANARRSKLDFVRLDDLLWVYSSVTTKKIYGLIPYRWIHALQLADRHGKVTEIKGSKAKLPELAGAVAQRAPWAIVGYSDELQAIYQRNRQIMIDAVAERRQQIVQGGGQAAPAAGDGSMPV